MGHVADSKLMIGLIDGAVAAHTMAMGEVFQLLS